MYSIHVYLDVYTGTTFLSTRNSTPSTAFLFTGTSRLSLASLSSGTVCKYHSLLLEIVCPVQRFSLPGTVHHEQHLRRTRLLPVGNSTGTLCTASMLLWTVHQIRHSSLLETVCYAQHSSLLGTVLMSTSINIKAIRNAAYLSPRQVLNMQHKFCQVGTRCVQHSFSQETKCHAKHLPPLGTVCIHSICLY